MAAPSDTEPAGSLAGGLSARPAEDPVEARQILVTIMELLGIPTVQTDVQGLVAAVLEGAAPIRRLYA